jgi:hypothetical protein
MSMNIQNKDFIFTTFGVSGREDKVREYYRLTYLCEKG